MPLYLTSMIIGAAGPAGKPATVAPELRRFFTA